MKSAKENPPRAKRLRPVRTSDAKLSLFARRLFVAWRKLGLPLADASIVTAVSGGADSSALMLALAELITRGRLELSVVVAHLDHALRPTSRDDGKWVASLA